MKRWIKYLILLMVIALLAGTFYKKVYIPKSTYTTIKPTVGELQVSIKGIGNVGALNIYSITAQTGGKILKIVADNGDWVKKDDLLISMDGVDLPQQQSMAKANLLKAKYEVKSVQNELKNQKAQKRLLQITYARYNRLKEKGFASQSEYDKAKADLQSIEASISSSLAKIDAAKATVVVSSKNIEAVDTKINRLKVYAPVNGYVISKNAEVAQSVLPSTPILKIVNPKDLWVATKVDERISAQIKPMQTAIITLRSQPNKTYQGFVKRVNVSSDAVTFEREIDVAFTNIPKPFYMNEQAEVKIQIRNYENVIKIPLNVVVNKHQNIGVWTVENNHAHFKIIQKIAQNNDEMAVANMDKNTQIIIPDIKKKALKEGMKIHL